MGEQLKELLEAATRIEMTRQQREDQRRSCAYGNAGLENDRITREMVDEQAEKLKKTEE